MTRAQSKIPGFRTAGVFTAGTAQRLFNIDGLMIGTRIIIVGSGDIGLIMARRCTLEGAQVSAVIEKLHFPSGLNRNVVQCVRDFQVPLYLGHQLTFIEGKRRVTGVRFREANGRQGMREKSVECDTVLLSVGLIPEIGEDEILLKPMSVGVCGSEVLTYRLSGRGSFGHEPAGYVYRVGKRVKNVKEGDRVIIHHHIPCFVCHYFFISTGYQRGRALPLQG